MKNNVKNTIAGVLLTLIQTWAMAQISQEVAEELTRKSGTWAQLENTNLQVKAGMAQSPLRDQLGLREVERLEQLADDVFSTPKLRQSFIQALSRSLNELQSKESLRWYDSPTGKMITAIEEAASAAGADMNSMLGDGNETLNRASEKRRLLLSRLVTVTRSAEGLATMQINVAKGVVSGVYSALPAPAQASVDMDEFGKALALQRPQMVAAMRGFSLSMFAWMYKSVSDKDLDSYAKFLSSKSGAALSVALIYALDYALTDAAKAFGQGIPKPPSPI
jgi:hypothetical protein